MPKYDKNSPRPILECLRVEYSHKQSQIIGVSIRAVKKGLSKASANHILTPIIKRVYT